MMKPVWQIFKFPLDNGSLYSFQLTTGRQEKRDGIETGCLPDRPNPSLIYIHASFSNPPVSSFNTANGHYYRGSSIPHYRDKRV
jgi:hypothetical protein